MASALVEHHRPSAAVAIEAEAEEAAAANPSRTTPGPWNHQPMPNLVAIAPASCMQSSTFVLRSAFSGSLAMARSEDLDGHGLFFSNSRS